jgi:microcystin-dependent protein
MARREYTAGRPTTLAEAFAIGASTFTIADDGSATGWPTSADYDFWVTIDAGTAQEERVLCSGRSGRVVTVATGGRGKDGTSESNHSQGATVWPSWSATDADEANAHVNSAGYSPYSVTVHGLGSGDGVVVGTDKAQTLTLKTLTSPKINENVAVTATSTELNYVDGVTSPIQNQLNANTPTGVVNMWVTPTAPSGWLLCQGQAVSRTTYSALWDVLRAGGPTSPYGNGDGSTTFNLPDLRSRVPMGAGTGRNVADSADLTARTLGAKVSDAETVTLTAAQSGLRQHGHTAQQNAHSHGIGYTSAGNNYYAFGQITDLTRGGTDYIENRAFTSDAQQPYVSVNDVAAAAALEAHTNTQPSTVINFIIKT